MHCKAEDNSNTDYKPLSVNMLKMDKAKRIIDIVGSCIGLMACSPLLLVASAVILIRDGHPLIYKQWRVGAHGRLFQIFKLRTMKSDAESATGAVCATKGDVRVIPGCRWIRICHVDEMPQFFNILQGQMSMVGPRPERPELIYTIRQEIDSFEERLSVKPGLTGLAQLSMGYCNNMEGHRQKLAFDMTYINERSNTMDLKMIAQTIAKPLDQAAA